MASLPSIYLILGLRKSKCKKTNETEKLIPLSVEVNEGSNKFCGVSAEHSLGRFVCFII